MSVKCQTITFTSLRVFDWFLFVCLFVFTRIKITKPKKLHVKRQGMSVKYQNYIGQICVAFKKCRLSLDFTCIFGMI